MINYQSKESRQRMVGWTGRSSDYRELELVTTKLTGYALEHAKNMVRKDLELAGYTLSKKEFELAWWIASAFTKVTPKAADLMDAIIGVGNGEIQLTATTPKRV